MVTGKPVIRPDDMHANRALKLRLQSDGDVMVMITQEGVTIGGIDTGNPGDCAASLEFCVSGGRSRRTLQALHDLAEAMRLDNEERPI